MLVLLAIAAVMLLVAKSDGESSSTSSPPGGDGSLYMSCEEAIEHLPESMRFNVAAAIFTGTDGKMLLELANVLETAASAQPDPYLRAALLVCAHCARDRAVGVGTGGTATPGPGFAPDPVSSSSSPAGFAPSSTPGPSTVASSPSSSSSLSSSSTVPSTTADGSAPIFGRMDASEHAARIGTTYAATAQPGTALRR